MSYQGAALLSAAEDHEGAVSALYEAGGGDGLPAIPVPDRQSAWEILTRAALARGDVEGADALVGEAEELAAGFGLGGLQGVAARCRALVQEAQDDHAGAAESARRASELAAESGALLDAERARMALARSLLADGHRGPAADELARAEANLGELGAEALRAQAAREMRRLGRRARRRPAPSREDSSADAGELGSLSEREREGADLVAERPTNREIAESLTAVPT